MWFSLVDIRACWDLRPRHTEHKVDPARTWKNRPMSENDHYREIWKHFEAQLRTFSPSRYVSTLVAETELQATSNHSTCMNEWELFCCAPQVPKYRSHRELHKLHTHDRGLHNVDLRPKKNTTVFTSAQTQTQTQTQDKPTLQTSPCSNWHLPVAIARSRPRQFA